MRKLNYLEALAEDIRARVPSDALPEGDTGLMFLMYAVLARAKGAAVTTSDVHDAWSAWMTPLDPEHESLVPYEALPPDVRTEDHVFLTAIRDAATAQGQARDA